MSIIFPENIIIWTQKDDTTPRRIPTITSWTTIIAYSIIPLYSTDISGNNEYTIIARQNENPIFTLLGTFAILKKGAANTKDASLINIKTNSSNCAKAKVKFITHNTCHQTY